jgi:coenzyme F420-dependent glucose-6-phosphate dehydrogenase
VSTPEEAVADIQPYINSRFDHLVFHGRGRDQHRFLSRFTEDATDP